MNNLILQEAYFGKTPEVLKIEKVVAALKNKYDGNYYNLNINKDPMRLKLDEAIEEAFGFNPAYCLFVATSDMNAQTISTGMRIDVNNPKHLIVKTNNGYKYNPKAEVSTMFLLLNGLFFNPDMSPGEVTAILLHEIGHNFTSAQDNTQFVMSKIQSVIYLMTSLLQPLDLVTFPLFFTNKGMTSNVEIRRWLEKHPVAYYPVEIFGMGYNMLMDVISQINSFFTVLAGIVGPIALTVNTIANLISRLIFSSSAKIELVDAVTGHGYTDERFADNFAAMYGYSEELISGLSKLEYGDRNRLAFKMLNASPFFKNWYDLSLIPSLLFISAIDPHPNLMARITNILDKLEADDAMKQMPPKMKNKLKHDISKTRECIDFYRKKATSKVDINQDKDAIKMQWYGALLKFCNGDIAHHIYTRSSGQEINDRFEKLIKKIK